MFFSVVIVAIVFISVISIVKMALDHHERIERIRHGYPLKEGDRPVAKDYIDVTEPRQQ